MAGKPLRKSPPRSATYRCLAAVIAPAGWGTEPCLPSWIDWNELLAASSEHVVTLALAWRLSDDRRVPEPLRNHLRLMLSLARARNDQLRTGLEQIGRLLNDAEIVPMLLKGAAHLATNLYPDDGMRYLGDVDLLIPEQSLVTAQAALEGAGFVSGNASAYAPDHRHLPMMEHEDWRMRVELHRMPVRRQWCSIIDSADLFRQAREVSLGKSNFVVPSRTQSVIVGIINGQLIDEGHRRGVPWLRSLLDFAEEVAVGKDAIDWHDIEHRFRAGEPRVLSNFLALAQELMQVPAAVPDSVGSRAAAARLDAVLDRSDARRVLSTGGDIARAARRMLSNPLRVQLEALTVRRWRAQLQRFGRRW